MKGKVCVYGILAPMGLSADDKAQMSGGKGDSQCVGVLYDVLKLCTMFGALYNV